MTEDDIKYYSLRIQGRYLGKTYVSESFPKDTLNRDLNLRFLHRIFKTDSNSTIEKDINSNLIIVTTAADVNYQVRVLVYEKNNAFKEVMLQKIINGKPSQEIFSFKDNQLADLVKFLHDIQFIDFDNKHNFKLYDKGQTIITLDSKEKELLDFFNLMSLNNRTEFLETLKKGQNFTKEDLDILSGRRQALELFNNKLNIEKDWDEKNWQKFFEDNTWIFGYGLDYKFLKILQKEAHISNIDLSGSNAVKGDFLLGTSKFTVLVELKRPDTPLLITVKDNQESGKNRSDSWRLSNNLIDAVSQILAQKSNWQIKGNDKDNFTSEGEAITQYTVDPKTILIIGNLNSIEGTSQTKKVKEKTFELFRRDSRNIEIITFDELFERAYFIVNQKELQ
jgi:hypothetical protein